MMNNCLLLEMVVAFGCQLQETDADACIISH
jgi:hypothetical protein